MSSNKPSSINLGPPPAPSSGTATPVGGANGGSGSGGATTPTQEKYESLSKRRGSDTLSIGIPGSSLSSSSSSDEQALPRTRPNLGALASLNAASAAGKDLSDLSTPLVGGINALGLGGVPATAGSGTGNSSAPRRPPVSRTSLSALVVDDDGDDDDDDDISSTGGGDQGDDEAGYEGEREAHSKASSVASPSPSRSSTTSSHGTAIHHHHQHHQPHHTNGHSSSSSQQQQQPGSNINTPYAYNHRSYMEIPAHERGHCPSNHDAELNGQQPMRRPRQHQRTSTASSMGSTSGSNRKEREHMKPFPTPGMKTPSLPPPSDRSGSSSSKTTNGHAHAHASTQQEERDPFDDIKSAEECRLAEARDKKKHWKRWGPYLSERQWATVREDYSANGDAWTHFPHEHARSRAYRWGEDGLGGVSDNHQRLCFGLALWNGQDPILKERLFGVTGHQGNHGEDVKELYYYLDSTPTHSYMKYLYKYPQRRFPYEKLVEESTQRSRDVVEYEITDTDAFEDDKYWDIFVEYAKDEDDENGMSVRITAYNRGPEPADLHIIPQLWFRNTWSWPKERPTGKDMPNLKAVSDSTIQIDHKTLGRYYCHLNESPGPIEPIRRSGRGGAPAQPIIVDESVTPELLFTHNDTNFQRLYGGQNAVPYVKDAFHDHIIPSHRPAQPKTEAEEKPAVHVADSGTTDPEHVRPDGDDTPPASIPSTPQPTKKYTEPSPPQPTWPDFVNPAKEGTKFGAHYTFNQVPPNGGCCVVRLKLTDKDENEDEACLDEELFDDTIQERRTDADEFYARFNSGAISDDLRNIMRQALSGMLWTKQFYYFVQKEWIEGDPGQPPPPPERQWVRNRDWRHLHCEDILSMPDKWEYPFFAAWDTAFHCIPLAMVDPDYAKNQLMLMVREWYMKPDGALPAYEWNYGDVNPPVHAWATFRVFKIERKMYGREDIGFLERVFQKLLMNFTWWVNRKDAGGNNVFEGGFLGLDNIGLFNRSEPLPTGGVLRQADGTAWMAFYCLNMLNMALELAKHNPSYEDIASKFFEHFLFISDAMTFKSGDVDNVSLWNEEDGFYYDAISWSHGHFQQLPVRSLVGLIPLYGTLTLEPGIIKKFTGFKKRMDWFIENRTEISGRNIANMKARGKGDRKLLALCSEDRLRALLQRMLDETEFLSDYGVRSLSRAHKGNPYSMNVNGQEFSVDYWPGDSHSGMFGGNSNWRGPIWLAVNFLLIESLQRFHQFYGNEFKIECPTGSGDFMTLANVADEIQHRIIHIFARDHEGRRAYNGGSEKLNKDPHFRDHVQFHEFFHADNGRGLGASHQTGWTGLVAWFIWQSGHSARMPRTPRTPRTTAMHYFDEIVPSTPGGSEYETDFTSDFLSASELSPDEL